MEIDNECHNCKYDNLGESDQPCKMCIETEDDYEYWEPMPGNDQRPIYSINNYQRDALRTAGMETQSVKFSNFGLGLSGEAGEVTDYIKKVLYHGHKLEKSVLCKELGDVMWYIAALADAAGLTLEEVARVNIDKLRTRYPDGFSHERSVNRNE